MTEENSNEMAENLTSGERHHEDERGNCEDFLSPTRFLFFFAPVRYGIVALGLGLNILVLFMSVQHKQCKSIKFRHFAVSLALVDASCCVFLFLYLQDSFVDSLGEFGISVLVAVRNYYLWLPMTALIPTLVSRYMAVKHPTKYNLHFTPKAIYFYFFLSVIIPLLISFPLLVVDTGEFWGDAMRPLIENNWHLVYIGYTAAYYLFLLFAVVLASKVTLATKKFAKQDKDGKLQRQLNKAVIFQVCHLLLRNS